MHMHKRKTLATVLGVFGLLAAVAPLKAHASVHHVIRYQGNSCVSSPNPSTAVHDIYGVNNPSSSSDMTVYCPMPITVVPGVAHTIYRVGIGGYDRNTSSNIFCDVLSTTVANGTTAILASVQTSGGGPGTGYQTATSFLPFFPVDTEALYLKCTVPRTQSGWASHLVFYDIDYLTP